MGSVMGMVMGLVMVSVIGSIVVGHGDGQDVNIGIGHEVGHGVLVKYH